MSNTIEYLKHRFACKNYLDKPIEKAVLDTILEAGRLSPSSFDLEHWTFHVTRSKDILTACFNQESMKTAPITIVITAKRGKFFELDSEFIKERASRFPGGLDVFIPDFEGYYEYLKSTNSLDWWSKAQCYIAASYMMIAAAELGVQSCAIEGFDNDKLLDALGVNKDDERVGIAIAFGYPAESERAKIRESIDKLTVYHI